MDRDPYLKGTLIERSRKQVPDTEAGWKEKTLIQRDSGDEFTVKNANLIDDRITLVRAGGVPTITLQISRLKDALQTENGAWSFKV